VKPCRIKTNKNTNIETKRSKAQKHSNLVYQPKASMSGHAHEDGAGSTTADPKQMVAERALKMGDRVLCGENKATVRFVGAVPPTKGEWSRCCV
jgi:hypothetical protein